NELIKQALDIVQCVRAVGVSSKLHSFDSAERARVEAGLSWRGSLDYPILFLFGFGHVSLYSATKYYQTQLEIAIRSILSTQPIWRMAVSNFSLRSTRRVELTFTRTSRSLSTDVSNITSQLPAWVLIT